MTNDEQQIYDDVTEASFLLDLFDAGMGICFDHTFGIEPIFFNDDYDVEAFVQHFLEQCKNIMSEREIELVLNINNSCVTKGNSHELRIIINLIVYEMILKSGKSLSISLNKNCLTLSADTSFEEPLIWGTIKDVCKKRGISFIFSDKGCSLEFVV
jgi:hypothetical protein